MPILESRGRRSRNIKPHHVVVPNGTCKYMHVPHLSRELHVPSQPPLRRRDAGEIIQLGNFDGNPLMSRTEERQILIKVTVILERIAIT